MVPFISRRIALFVVCSFSLALLMVDHTTSWLDPVRLGFNRILSPVYELAGVTRHAADQSEYWFETKDQLVQRISELESQQLAREVTLQNYAQLAADNQSLRDLLALNETKPNPLMAAQALVQQITTTQHKIVIDKGSADGVLVNSIVFDSKGIIGQVHFVSEDHAWVTLISDPLHAMPVIIGTKGTLGVVRGLGELNQLEIAYVPETAKIEEGDMITAAGTGGRFPKGYPVARVSYIGQTEDNAFARLEASPLASLSQIRFVLIMLPQSDLALLEQDETKDVD